MGRQRLLWQRQRVLAPVVERQKTVFKGPVQVLDVLELERCFQHGAVAQDHNRVLNRGVLLHVFLHVRLLQLLDQVAVNFVQAERAARLEHTMGDLGHVTIVIWHQMEAEHVLTRIKIDVVVSQHQVIAIVKFLAASDVYLAQVEARCNKLSQALTCDISAAHVNFLQVRELLGQTSDPLIFQVTAPEEAYFAKKPALLQPTYTIICYRTAFRK